MLVSLCCVSPRACAASAHGRVRLACYLMCGLCDDCQAARMMPPFLFVRIRVDDAESVLCSVH